MLIGLLYPVYSRLEVAKTPGGQIPAAERKAQHFCQTYLSIKIANKDLILFGGVSHYNENTNDLWLLKQNDR